MDDWERLVSQNRVRSNVGLRKLTTYKLGGAARWYAEAGSQADLRLLANAWKTTESDEMLVLGKGSNVIVADQGYSGLVIRLVGEFQSIRHLPDQIEAGGGVGMPLLARSAVSQGRLGLEFLVGIPGTVGGGVAQNAGCLGQEMVDVLVSAEVFDFGETRSEVWPVKSLGLGYRSSRIGPAQVVTRSWFRFTPGETELGLERLREITRWRRLHQPGGTLNAGSVFKNPPEDAAGRIIDSLGLKGMRVGGARVSEKHANFFVADRDATSEDVRRLVTEIRCRVKDSTGIDLEPEVRFVGFDVGRETA